MSDKLFTRDRLVNNHSPGRAGFRLHGGLGKILVWAPHHQRSSVRKGFYLYNSGGDWGRIQPWLCMTMNKKAILAKINTPVTSHKLSALWILIGAFSDLCPNNLTPVNPTNTHRERASSALSVLTPFVGPSWLYHYIPSTYISTWFYLSGKRSRHCLGYTMLYLCVKEKAKKVRFCKLLLHGDTKQHVHNILT